jgi:hypothetical protein
LSASAERQRVDSFRGIRNLTGPTSVGPVFLFARHVMNPGGVSPLWAVVTGTTRLGQGVRREAESEGSRCRNSDSTHRNRIQGWSRWGNAAMDAEAQTSLVGVVSRSGEVRGKDSRLNLGGLVVRWRPSLWWRPLATALATTRDGWREVSRGRSRRGPSPRSTGTLARKGRNSQGSQGR